MKKYQKIIVRTVSVLLLLIFFLPLLTRCISFSKSDKAIRKFFKESPVKPVFKTYLIADTQIHFAEIGNDTLPTVIFVHGSPGSWDNFIDFFKNDTLLKIAHLIAVDRPGFGKSDAGNIETELEQVSYLLSPVLQLNHSKKPPILVGHSMGGPVIARLAMDFPEQVGGLIFVAGSVDPAQEKKEWFRPPLKFFGSIGFLSDEIKVSNAELMRLKVELDKMLPLWKKINCPVTIIQGDADMLVPAANADFAKNRLVHNPAVKMVWLPKVNHFIPWSHPQVMSDAIVEQIEMLNGSALKVGEK
jgi:pimeloyl-ACP methyl ester carboxylesterase